MINESNPAKRSFQQRLTNSNVPGGVDVEESIGKATEDFGGYDLDDNKSGDPRRLHYEPVDDSGIG